MAHGFQFGAALRLPAAQSLKNTREAKEAQSSAGLPSNGNRIPFNISDDNIARIAIQGKQGITHGTRKDSEMAVTHYLTRLLFLRSLPIHRSDAENVVQQTTAVL